jgi:hypothetical protein
MESHPPLFARALPSSDERGFSLMEAVVGTAIATIAVLGLAYTFGTGRGLISRYEVGRVALGVAQTRLETFAAVPPESISAGAQPFTYHGAEVGTEQWTVADVNDPLTTAADDYRRVTVTVTWGSGADQQNVALSRLFPRP